MLLSISNRKDNDMKEENPTYPVILLGVDKKESLGFQKLRVIQEDSEGLQYI